MAVAIGPAAAEEFPAILRLIDRSGLPPDGLSDHLGTALVARAAGNVVGSAALEIYGTAALLRSVAVDGAFRSQGLGQQLTRAALDLALDRGVTEVFLLTETAGDFFPRFGFRPILRDNVPLAVQQSVEWTCTCPSSALVMALSLSGS